MPPVAWTVIGGDLAETVLSNLLYHDHTNAVRIRPSRGDLGIDVLVPSDPSGEPFDVYQIKKFAKNLDDSEKRQIKDSFRRFLVGVGRHNVPAEDWYLMMPLDPTKDNYLTWFKGMPDEVIAEIFSDTKLSLTVQEKQRITAWRQADGRRIDWKGAIYCNNLAAKYRFVIDYYINGADQTIRDAVKEVASLAKMDQSLPGSSNASTVALRTPADMFDHLTALQRVLDTDPHYRYGISLDPTAPEVMNEPDLVAATQVSQEDGQTITVRVYQRFTEALNERPIELNFQIRTDHATFDRHAFDMWRKYGKALTAPAEVTADLPGGLGNVMPDGIAELSIAPAGEVQDARFRIRRPDGSTGNPLPITITMSEGTAGNSGQGSDQTGLLTFEVISDRETRIGTWQFTWKGIIGAEIVAALPCIEFQQELRAPNTLEIASKYGQFVKYADIPPDDASVFPDNLVDYLRALAKVQTATPTPILIPDLTTVSVANAESVFEAAALVSGQTVLSTWNELQMAGDTSLQPAGVEQHVSFENEYQLMIIGRFVVTVGAQELLLGTVAKMALSARYSVEDGKLVARPHRNNALRKWFSPSPNAATAYDKRVLGRVIGRVDDSAHSRRRWNILWRLRARIHRVAGLRQPARSSDSYPFPRSVQGE